MFGRFPFHKLVILPLLVFLVVFGTTAFAQEKGEEGRQANPARSKTLTVTGRSEDGSAAPAGAGFRVQTSGAESYDSGNVLFSSVGGSWSRSFTVKFLKSTSYSVTYFSQGGSDADTNYTHESGDSGSLTYFGSSKSETGVWYPKYATLIVRGDTNGSGNAPSGAMFRVWDGGSVVVNWTAIGADPSGTPNVLPRNKTYTVEYNTVPNYWREFNELVYLNNLTEDVTGDYQSSWGHGNGKINVRASIDGSPGAPAGSSFKIVHNGGRFETSWRSLNADGSAVTVSGLDVDVLGQGYKIYYTQNPTGYTGATMDSAALRWLDKESTVTGEYTANTYTITTTVAAGSGTIAPMNPSVTHNSPSPTFNFSAATGYEIEKVMVDGSDKGAISSYTFPSNITSAHAIQVYFKLKTYTIDTEVKAGSGTIVPGDTTVNHGASAPTFNFSPATGYEIEKVEVDGSNQGVITSYTFPSVITANHTIHVYFKLKTYTIDTEVKAGSGTIVPGDTVVSHGSSAPTFNFNPATGYEIEKVEVDGSNQGVITSYTFPSVITANHTIHVYFKLKTYTIDTEVKAASGTITPGDTTVNHGDSAPTFNFNADTGYEVDKVEVDGVDKGAITSYTFPAVITANHTIDVYFKLKVYTYTATVSTVGGTITPLGDTLVTHGTSQAYLIAPDTDYHLLDVVTGSSGSVLGSLVDNLNGTYTYTFVAVTGPDTIDAAFEHDTGNLKVNINPAGVVSAGAQWKLATSTGWRAPGSTAYGIDTGTNLMVEFSPVDGWIKPANAYVTITKDKTTTITVEYTEIAAPAGSLSVVFDPQLDIEGAMWQLNETGSAPASNVWHRSGDVLHGVAPGTYTLSYNTVPGYVKPQLHSVTILANKTYELHPEYVRPFVAHKTDYNGDGAEDLAIYDAETRHYNVVSIAGQASPSAMNDIVDKKLGRSTDIMTPGDYDGDGIADLSYYRPSKGQWRVLKQFKLRNFGDELDIPVPGDFNGDGRTQPALYRPSTGEWFIYDYDTENVIKVTFGSNVEIPVPGNWDGDEFNTTDLGVFNVENGTWRVAIYNENKGEWRQKRKYTVVYGSEGDIPIHGDYDGDGKADVAVFRRNGNLWLTNGILEDNLEFGEDGDIPVPNDWAGLGRVIPAIFRARNGKWLSVDNLLSARHGAGGQPLVSGGGR